MKGDGAKLLVFAGLGAAVWYFGFGPGKAQAAAAPSSAPPAPGFQPTPSTGPNNVDPCAAARRLIALGHAQEAAYWTQQCHAQGGTV